MFDPHGTEIGAEFYTNVDDASCTKAKLHVDPDTVEWWSRQSQQARDSLMLDQKPIEDVLWDFFKWVTRQRGIFVWSHGANFDEPIIQAAAYAIGQRVPWKFWDVRDTRTVYDMAQFNPRSVKRSGTYHNALDDARHQAVCVQRAYAKIKTKGDWDE